MESTPPRELTIRTLATVCQAPKRTVLYHAQLGALPVQLQRRGLRRQFTVALDDAAIYARDVWNVVISPVILARIGDRAS